MSLSTCVPQLVIDLAQARENIESYTETIVSLENDLRQSKENNRKMIEQLREKDVINFKFQTQLRENEEELNSLRQQCERLEESLKIAENNHTTRVTSVGDLQCFVNRGI